MTIVKPHTLNRPLAELRQLRERPELVELLSHEEILKLARYAIEAEEWQRDGLKSGHPMSAGDALIVRHEPAPAA